MGTKGPNTWKDEANDAYLTLRRVAGGKLGITVTNGGGAGETIGLTEGKSGRCWSGSTSHTARGRRRAISKKPPRGPPRYRTTDPKKRTVDGIIFASKAEMTRYLELKDLKADGRVRWFIRQPTFDLAGPVYKADFLVVWDSGSVSVEEVKSPNHRYRPDWTRTKRNMEQVFHLYGIKVALLERS